MKIKIKTFFFSKVSRKHFPRVTEGTFVVLLTTTDINENVIWLWLVSAPNNKQDTSTGGNSPAISKSVR
jgi:hypothetical protein